MQDNMELARARETISQLHRENEQSKQYIERYERQIRDLEHEVEQIQ